ncbi:unnamed protein product [[Candida] boidinii]|nr:unnamed protein product [[Candida] boidinii]
MVSAKEEVVNACLDLFRRLDPKNTSTNLINLCLLVPDQADDLLNMVDKPLGVKRCEVSGKNYLTCDYNRDGDSYRSPWSDKYFPQEEADAPHPGKILRQMEIFANESFDIYRGLYYEGGISSVYLWDNNEDGADIDESGKVGFAGVALLKKSINPQSNGTSGIDSGSWDSIHVFEIDPTSSSSAIYQITSTVILDISTENKSEDDSIYLSGNLTRQVEKELPFENSSTHISNVGSLVEDMEFKLRNILQEVYFGKTKDILGDIRSIENLSLVNEDKLKHEELVKGFQSL